MADMRLAGTQLRVVRMLAGNPLTKGLMWAITSKDFKIAELMALPASARLPVDDSARPVQGAPPRQWGADDAPAPARTDGCTSAELVAAYQSGASDPVAVLDRALARVKANDFGPATYSPYIALDEGPARAAAAASAARHREKRSLGPLDGVPMCVKDEVDVVGHDTLGGTTYLRGNPARADAWVVKKLRDAGAVVYAKSHCPEWGLNPLGISQFYDFPRNAWRNDRGAGGSSTGTAVATALGLAPVGLGSDGGGSIRIPSATNGVFGIKPTYIRIGRTGDLWGPGTMPHLGPLGRSTADLVEFLAATAGVDPQDGTSTMQPDVPINAWRAALTRSIKGCRIGVVRSEWKDTDPAIADAGMRALDQLARDGAVLVDVEIPLAAHAPAVGAIAIASESTANISDDLARYRDQFGEEMLAISSFLSNVTAREFLGAARTRAAMRRQVASVLAGVDVLALPVMARFPVPYALSESRQAIMDTGFTAGMTRFAFLGNLTGLPAGSVPVGVHDGLPIGLQILADAWDEASVFAVMAACERSGISAIPACPGFKSLL